MNSQIQTTDTLLLDARLIQEWKTGKYDYDRELAKPKSESKPQEEFYPSSSVDPFRAISNFVTNKMVRTCISVVTILLLLGMIFYVVKKRMLYVRQRDDFEIPKEDTIYGVDFAKLIGQMEAKGDHYQCIRLRYLQLLRYLHDMHRIHWLPSKTTALYVSEMRMKEFADISNIFMKIRYGNYPASASLYEEVNQLNDIILEKVETQKKAEEETAHKSEEQRKEMGA